jgi:hypothetical protein
MAETMVLDRLAGVNGAAQRQSRTGKPRGKAERKPRGGSRKGMRAAKRLAVVCGGIASAVLALSVVHCTEAIGTLTGSHWLLAALLAIGIDAGAVVAEVAEVSAHGTKAQQTVGRWAAGYTAVAVVLSMGLNAYAFSRHAEGALVWAATALGVVIPGLVYGLGRVAAHLWRAGE